MSHTENAKSPLHVPIGKIRLRGKIIIYYENLIIRGRTDEVISEDLSRNLPDPLSGFFERVSVKSKQ
jgi:hypothetical protein